MQLSEIQKNIYEMYIHHDSKRGVEKTLEWFLTEVYELYSAVKEGSEIGGEAADVLAWLLSLCNLLDIDLEKEFMEKYGDKCPKCRTYPCRCEYRETPNKRVKISRIQ